MKIKQIGISSVMSAMSVSHWLCAHCFRVSSCTPPAWRGTSLTCFTCGATYSTGVSSDFISPAVRGRSSNVLSSADAIVDAAASKLKAEKPWHLK